MSDVIRIEVEVGAGGPVKTFRGRFAKLSSLESPGVRLSHYVHILRRSGVPIVTHNEQHGGTYSGRHGRYQLAAPVTVINREVAHG